MKGSNKMLIIIAFLIFALVIIVGSYIRTIYAFKKTYKDLKSTIELLKYSSEAAKKAFIGEQTKQVSTKYDNDILRKILIQCAEEVGGVVSMDCSIEFLAGVPKEIRLNIDKLRDDLSDKEDEIAIKEEEITELNHSLFKAKLDRETVSIKVGQEVDTFKSKVLRCFDEGENA